MPIKVYQGLFACSRCSAPLFSRAAADTGRPCHNIGRIAAAGATVFFGLFQSMETTTGWPVYSSTAFYFCPPQPWHCC